MLKSLNHKSFSILQNSNIEAAPGDAALISSSVKYLSAKGFKWCFILQIHHCKDVRTNKCIDKC